MNLELVSWAGHPINDLTDYRSYVLPESKFAINSQPVTQDRAENYPYLSGAVLPVAPFTFQITILNDSVKTQDDLRQQLAGWFNPLDFQYHALIAKDTNDNDKLYQLIGLVSLACETVPKGQVMSPS